MYFATLCKDFFYYIIIMSPQSTYFVSLNYISAIFALEHMGFKNNKRDLSIYSLTKKKNLHNLRWLNISCGFTRGLKSQSTSYPYHDEF